MKSISLCLFASVLCLSAFCQENENRYRLKAASASIGLSSVGYTPPNFSDFEKLAPEMKLKRSDLIGFDQFEGFVFSGGTALNFNAVFAKELNERTQLYHPELRIGFTYSQTTALELSYNQSNSFVVDTLTSSRSGSITLVDSTYSETYDLSYNTSIVALDADYLVSTNPQNRFKFYGGIGASIGMTINAYTRVSYSESKQLDQNVDNFEDSFDFQSQRTTYRNKSSFYARLYVPVGLDFRIGKRKEWAKQFHLFQEFRPSLNLQSIPELSLTSANTGINSLFGLRYEF